MDREEAGTQRREIERTLLGWYIVQPESLQAAPPDPDVFSPEGAQVLSAIRAAGRNGGINAATVWHELQRAESRLDLDTYQQRYLLPPLPRTGNPESYLAWLGSRRKESRAVELGRALLQALEDQDAPKHVLEDLIAEIRDALTAKADQILEAIDLSTINDQDDEPPWLIPGWLADRDVTIIGGEPGSGKSMLALDLALALSSGRPFLGMPVREPRRVLYVDEEQPRRLARRRLRMFLGRQYEAQRPPQLDYLHENGLNLDNPTHRDLFRARVLEFNPDWIVLDSLIRFHRRDENSNTDMSGFYVEVLKPIAVEAQAGLVILHHLAKPSKDRPDISHRLRGASDIRAMVDQAWALEGDHSGRTRTMTHNKCRWDLTQPSMEIVYQEEDGISWLEAQRTKDAVSETIEAVLRHAGGRGLRRADCVKALMEQLGHTAHAAESAFKREAGRLKATGRIASDGKKPATYWTAEHAPQQEL